MAQNNLAEVVPPKQVNASRNTPLIAKIKVQVRQGYHVNSNTPADAYLIPTRLTWDAAPLAVSSIVYPKPQMQKFQFSAQPLSVFTGDFEIATTFTVPAKTAIGPAILSGKLRYQACNNTMCFPPKTVDVSLTVNIVK